MINRFFNKNTLAILATESALAVSCVAFADSENGRGSGARVRANNGETKQITGNGFLRQPRPGDEFSREEVYIGRVNVKYRRGCAVTFRSRGATEVGSCNLQKTIRKKQRTYIGEDQSCGTILFHITL